MTEITNPPENQPSDPLLAPQPDSIVGAETPQMDVLDQVELPQPDAIVEVEAPQTDSIEQVEAPQPYAFEQIEAPQHPAIESGGDNFPSEFTLINQREETPQTTHSSNLSRTNNGSIQVLALFLLGSFSICSAMLNLYLFWQARNLGAEIERLKPPAKSGLAPRH